MRLRGVGVAPGHSQAQLHAQHTTNNIVYFSMSSTSEYWKLMVVDSTS